MGPEGFELGDEAPDFELPDTAGRLHSLVEAEGAPAMVVVWTCNHCPYALAWHDRIIDVARDYAVPGTPYAVVLDVMGVVRGKGTVNTLEQLEGLVDTARSRLEHDLREVT